MNIGKTQAWCPDCVKITKHIHGKSMLGRLWKECTVCGRTSRFD